MKTDLSETVMPYTLVATGDLMLGRQIVREDAPETRRVFQLFHDADHAFVNLEQALTARGEPADKLVCLRGDPALAAELRLAGIDVVTIANNHAMDFGVTGLQDTIAAVAGAGVACVGGGMTLADSLSPAVLAAGSRRVAFLGLSCTLANSVGADTGRPGLAPVRVLTRFVVDPVLLQETPGVSPFVETVPMPGDVERAAAAVAAARKQSDIVIVGIHWGVPIGWVADNQDELATYQRPLGHALVDAGADAIIGHHSHCLHGVEIYKGRPIFYSLGNFLFHTMTRARPELRRTYPAYSWRSLRGEINRHGAVARLTWLKGAAAPQVEIIPVWLDQGGEPTLSSRKKAMAAINIIKSCSEKFGTRLEFVDEPNSYPRIIVGAS